MKTMSALALLLLHEAANAGASDEPAKAAVEAINVRRRIPTGFAQGRLIPHRRALRCGRRW